MDSFNLDSASTYQPNYEVTARVAMVTYSHLVGSAIAKYDERGWSPLMLYPVPSLNFLSFAKETLIRAVIATSMTVPTPAAPKVIPFRLPPPPPLPPANLCQPQSALYIAVPLRVVGRHRAEAETRASDGLSGYAMGVVTYLSGSAINAMVPLCDARIVLTVCTGLCRLFWYWRTYSFFSFCTFLLVRGDVLLSWRFSCYPACCLLS